MRVALAQVDPTVGDLEGNAALVTACIAEARRAGADLVAFPELVLSGYPPEDLLLKEHFLADCREALESLLPQTHDIVAVVGLPLEEEGDPSNAAAVLADGVWRATYRKMRLPNYAVFDERRYFAPGGEVLLLEQGGHRLSVNICEDIWSACGPTEEAALLGGAEVIVNISMSPYHLGKGRDRELMLRTRARDAGAYILYLNGVGGQDELVFDGESLVVDPYGEVLARAAQFEEALLLVDLDPARARTAPGAGRAGGLWPLRTVALPDRKNAPAGARTAAGDRLCGSAAERARPWATPRRRPGRPPSCRRWTRWPRSMEPSAWACGTTCARTASGTW